MQVPYRSLRALLGLMESDGHSSLFGLFSTLVQDRNHEMIHMSTEFKRFEFISLCRHIKCEIDDLRRRCLTRHAGVHILSIDVSGSHGHSWHVGISGRKGKALVANTISVNQWVLCTIRALKARIFNTLYITPERKLIFIAVLPKMIHDLDHDLSEIPDRDLVHKIVTPKISSIIESEKISEYFEQRSLGNIDKKSGLLQLPYYHDVLRH